MASSEARENSEYQVFLSFRGADTRYGFTDCLYHSLVDAGVRVFRDEDELRVGEVIGGNLLRAINNSILYMPIFSQTYACSKWCLRELAHMVGNVSESKGSKSILPIYFDVEPDDIKLKTQHFRKAFLKHEEEFPNEVEAWKRALGVTDKIKGWNLKKNEGQGAFIKGVVKEVLDILKIKHKYVTEHLVGLDDRVEDLTKLLDIKCNDVRVIGIHGMGGIGKTTLATVLFNQLSSHFGKSCSFLEAIREHSSTKEGMIQLQKNILSDIVGSGSLEAIEDSEQGMQRIGGTICNKKVLIVLDDVDHMESIRKLTGNYSLHSGSRIIITTRDTTVLQIKGFKGKILPYEVLKMDSGHALKLFSCYAFGGDFPPDDYGGLSNGIVSTTGGLPLALKVIGSLVYRKDKTFWEETLARLRSIPEKEVGEKLKISYDALDEYQQQIFLDIACFFFNKNKTKAIYMWADCQFFPERGIDVLVSRSLVKISENNKFWMHDQLIDLGKEIVYQESPMDPGKRSRLWSAKEALAVVRMDKKKSRVQALDLDGLTDPIEFTNEEFERFKNLRFLRLCSGTFAGDFAKCLSKLRWISWHSPLHFSASNMHLENLVVFELYNSGFRDDSEAWHLIKMARNLKVLSLTYCYGLTVTPDFSECLALERLTLRKCENLKKIDSSIGHLKSLVELKVKNCERLRYLPEEIGGLVMLKRLSLRDCSRLRELPDSLGDLTSLTELDVSRTGINKLPNSIEGLVNLESFILKDIEIKELPNSIGKLKSLRVLVLSNYRSCQLFSLWKLPSNIGMLKNLEELNLEGREEMKGEIPAEIGKLSSLRILNLGQTRTCRIPREINMLHQLQTLDLSRCHEIQKLPELPTGLTCLRLQSSSLISVPNLSNLTNLVELRLSDGSDIKQTSKLSTDCNLGWIRRLSKLNVLELNLQNVTAPPIELASLPHLRELTLSELDLGPLVQLPSSLLHLRLQFRSISSAGKPCSYLRLRTLTTLLLYFCGVRDIPLYGLPQLEKLTVDSCEVVKKLSIPSGLGKLRQVHLTGCPELVEIRFPGALESLESLRIDACQSFEIFKFLSEHLGCNDTGDIEVRDGLQSLIELAIRVGLISLPSSTFRKLRRFAVLSCPKVREIQVLGASESLEEVYVYDCESLGRIHGLSNLKILEYFHLERCYELTSVEGLDALRSLKFLTVKMCTSLRKLISASRTKIPDHCLVQIRECGEFIKDSCDAERVSLKCYREMLHLETSHQAEGALTIIFRVGAVLHFSEGFVSYGYIKQTFKQFAPDSVTYEGLTAAVKGLGYSLQRLWYEVPGTFQTSVAEIKTDEQVEEMVLLASEMRLIHLYVNGEVNGEMAGLGEKDGDYETEIFHSDEDEADQSKYSPKEGAFTITFHFGGASERSVTVGGIEQIFEEVAPDSVTYQGLIAVVKGLGYSLQKMWYEMSDPLETWVGEIKGDEQVEEMVLLASDRGFIHLYIEGDVEGELDGQVDSEENGDHEIVTFYSDEDEAGQGEYSSIEGAFTITFHVGGELINFVDKFITIGGIEQNFEQVAPYSVTYEGLTAVVKGLGYTLQRMWYEVPGLLETWIEEIKSDEQVEEMVVLASEKRIIHLYVEGEVDGELDEQVEGEENEDHEIKTFYSDRDEAGQREYSSMEDAFTIIFHVGGVLTNFSDKFVTNGGIEQTFEHVAPDSVTYEGLTAVVKGLGYNLQRMWYEIHGLLETWVEEIKSDEQVEEMMLLAYEGRFIHLYVEGEADGELEKKGEGEKDGDHETHNLYFDKGEADQGEYGSVKTGKVPASRGSSSSGSGPADGVRERGTASSSENGTALSSGSTRGSNSRKGLEFSKRLVKFKMPAWFRRSPRNDLREF